MPAGPSGGNVSELHTMLLGVSARTAHEELAWELCKLLSMDESVQKELYAYSHGISPLPAVAEDAGLLEQLHQDIPGGGGFAPTVIHDIMSSAVVVPRFDSYDQAMIMAERAVQEAVDGSQTGQSRMLTVQREINIFLNKS